MMDCQPKRTRTRWLVDYRFFKYVITLLKQQRLGIVAEECRDSAEQLEMDIPMKQEEQQIVEHLNNIITGWWFGTWLLFFHILIGNFILPFDSYFCRGVETTNQIINIWATAKTYGIMESSIFRHVYFWNWAASNAIIHSSKIDNICLYLIFVISHPLSHGVGYSMLCVGIQWHSRSVWDIGKRQNPLLNRWYLVMCIAVSLYAAVCAAC